MFIFTALSICTHGDVRLVGGETLNEGLIEVCFNSSWVSVCGGYNWNVNESTVICRQLTGDPNPCKLFTKLFTYNNNMNPCLCIAMNVLDMMEYLQTSTANYHLFVSRFASTYNE